ncbi:hypothetical protein [Mycoplasmopsis felis]|uniref:hypothetical protein n=1 Tax=Mycoplasmopsis felis TaxID=33923 RepID=UPI003A4E25A1
MYTYIDSKKIKNLVFNSETQDKDLENRKIVINELKSFYLEEINFANEHLQEHRNWSSNYNANSGRLIISPSFYNKNKNKDSEISYIKTFKELKQLN